jgi:hypothetical protein
MVESGSPYAVASRQPHRLNWAATPSFAWSATVDQRAAREVSIQFDISDTLAAFSDGGGLALLVWRAKFRIGVHFN